MMKGGSGRVNCYRAEVVEEQVEDGSNVLDSGMNFLALYTLKGCDRGNMIQ